MRIIKARYYNQQSRITRCLKSEKEIDIIKNNCENSIMKTTGNKNRTIIRMRNICVYEYLQDNKGAMTVEASFIIPMILILIMGIVFITMFYLDMMSAKSETIRVSNRVARYWKVDGDIETGYYSKEILLSRSPTFLITPGSSKVIEEGENFLTNSLKKRLIVTKMKTCAVSVKGYHVTAQVELSFLWPLSIVSSYFGNNGMTFVGKSQISIDNREELLRMIGGD